MSSLGPCTRFSDCFGAAIVCLAVILNQRLNNSSTIDIPSFVGRIPFFVYLQFFFFFFLWAKHLLVVCQWFGD